jgi:hypothetical protein
MPYQLLEQATNGVEEPLLTARLAVAVATLVVEELVIGVQVATVAVAVRIIRVATRAMVESTALT